MCPICRMKIGYDSDLMVNSPIPESKGDIPPLSKEIRRKQTEMAELFAKQKAKGGIIDLEEEKNKYLVTRVSIYIVIRLFGISKYGKYVKLGGSR